MLCVQCSMFMYAFLSVSQWILFFIVSIGLADFLGNINWTNLFLHWIGFTLLDVIDARHCHAPRFIMKKKRTSTNQKQQQNIIKRTITEENWGLQYTWLQTSKKTLSKKTNSKSKWMHTRFWNDRMQTSCNCDLTVMCNRFNDIDDIILTKPCGTHTRKIHLQSSNKTHTETERERETDEIDQQIKNKKK